MVEDVLEVPDDQRWHFQQVYVLVQTFDAFSKGSHFCFERRSLVDELLRFIPQFCVGFLQGSKIVIRPAR